MQHLEHVVFHLMRRVLQDHGARWQSELPQLTKPQYAALTAIDEHPGIEQTALGRRAAIDKATLAAMLARLEQRALIERTVDSYDRRRRVLHLTADGRRVLADSHRLAEKINGGMLQRLTATEADQLRELLAKLAADESGELAAPPENAASPESAAPPENAAPPESADSPESARPPEPTAES